MRLAIMQPYFFPYIGYFQLIAAVDQFVVYDKIKYTKKGWINRNRMLQNGKDVMFTLPLKNDSDYLDVCERELAVGFKRDKMLNQFKAAYRRAPYFYDTNLFSFLHNSIVKTCTHLGIATEIRISSDIAIDHELKNQDKVLALCEAVGASTYVNAIGGRELYSNETFGGKEIELKFIQSRPFEYAQLGDAFVPWLSIIDVMMFNSPEQVGVYVNECYELV
ncbi:MAG: WbqC family protein [Propionivibrio sp.]|uniref:WbqC family protein n=1 Tax=Candidatus Propionivibrio dominans TaxID=2954373 RepID=A0A9D7FAD5_9RHOO|nr:WbqC family protein [Candidatus Propionivibrio dominans]